MEKATPASALRARIVALEQRSIQQRQELHGAVGNLTTALRPSNLLANGLTALLAAPNLKTDLIGATMGMGTGYLVKKFVVAGSNGFFKNLVGNALGVLVSKNIAEYAPTIQGLVQTVAAVFYKPETPAPAASNTQDAPIPANQL